MLSYSDVLYVFSVREPQRIVRYQLVTDCLPCPVLSVLSTQRMLCSVIVRWKIEIGCGDTNGDDAIRYAMRWTKIEGDDEDNRQHQRHVHMFLFFVIFIFHVRTFMFPLWRCTAYIRFRIYFIIFSTGEKICLGIILYTPIDNRIQGKKYRLKHFIRTCTYNHFHLNRFICRALRIV